MIIERLVVERSGRAYIGLQVQQRLARLPLGCTILAVLPAVEAHLGMSPERYEVVRVDILFMFPGSILGDAEVSASWRLDLGAEAPAS